MPCRVSVVHGPLGNDSTANWLATWFDNHPAEDRAWALDARLTINGSSTLTLGGTAHARHPQSPFYPLLTCRCTRRPSVRPAPPLARPFAPRRPPPLPASSPSPPPPLPEHCLMRFLDFAPGGSWA